VSTSSPQVRAAIPTAVDREDFGYVEADLSRLTTACAAFLSEQYGWVVPVTRILPVADVLGGISTSLDVFVEPGSGVVVPTPAYPPFFEVVELTGRPAIATPMAREADRDVLDLDAIDAALATGARAVLLCNPLLTTHVPAISLRPPAATFLSWLDCSALGLDDPARFFLDHAHVALSDDPPFGSGCEQHVRLNFATSRALLEQIVESMGSAVARVRTP
jgi:bifunctional pyridoxal-dependent enzyme with beta-cystathionase and maltose regulon repressor activities